MATIKELSAELAELTRRVVVLEAGRAEDRARLEALEVLVNALSSRLGELDTYMAETINRVDTRIVEQSRGLEALELSGPRLEALERFELIRPGLERLERLGATLEDSLGIPLELAVLMVGKAPTAEAPSSPAVTPAPSSPAPDVTPETPPPPPLPPPAVPTVEPVLPPRPDGVIETTTRQPAPPVSSALARASGTIVATATAERPRPGAPQNGHLAQATVSATLARAATPRGAVDPFAGIAPNGSALGIAAPRPAGPAVVAPEVRGPQSPNPRAVHVPVQAAAPGAGASVAGASVTVTAAPSAPTMTAATPTPTHVVSGPTPAPSSSPVSSPGPAPSSAPASPGANPLKAAADGLNAQAERLQRAALLLPEGPQREAIMEKAGKIRAEASEIYGLAG